MLIKEKLTKKEIYQTAVMGSIWGIIEITIGTWMHLSKFPFKGLLLSLIAIFILVISKKIINYKGSLIMIGVLCATLKTAASGAFILNPIIAIIAESIIVEIIFTVGNYNFITAIIAGAMALFYTFMHSVIAQLFFFGFEIIAVYEKIFSKILPFVPSENITAYLIFGIYGAIYVIFGGLAGLIGYKTAIKTYNLMRIVNETN